MCFWLPQRVLQKGYPTGQIGGPLSCPVCMLLLLGVLPNIANVHLPTLPHLHPDGAAQASVVVWGARGGAFVSGPSVVCMVAACGTVPAPVPSRVSDSQSTGLMWLQGELSGKMNASDVHNPTLTEAPHAGTPALLQSLHWLLIVTHRLSPTHTPGEVIILLGTEKIKPASAHQSKFSSSGLPLCCNYFDYILRKAGQRLTKNMYDGRFWYFCSFSY